MKNYKQKYIEFCQHEANIPIYMQPWWLDVVCEPSNWEVCLSFDKEGKINGALPYYLQKKWGQLIVSNPPLTAYNGLWICSLNEPNMKNYRLFSRQKKILNNLIVQLPKAVKILFQFSPEFTYGLPFYWHGFELYTRYTHIYKDSKHQGQIIQNFKLSVRNDIRRAQKELTIIKSENSQIIYELMINRFAKKGLKCPYPKATFQKIDQILQQLNLRDIYLSCNRSNNNILAGLYIIKDGNTWRSVFSGSQPSHTIKGALHLLFWHTLNEAKQKGCDFDFEGSMVKSIESAIRAYGAKRQAYLQVMKYRNRFIQSIATLLGY